jgi:hypothetical protein
MTALRRLQHSRRRDRFGHGPSSAPGGATPRWPERSRNLEPRPLLFVQGTSQIRGPLAIAGAGKQASARRAWQVSGARDMDAAWAMKAELAEASTGVEMGP